MSVTDEQLFAKLKECYDPEIPCNIVDLGLVYDVQCQPVQGTPDTRIDVKMTLTSPGCPAALAIPEQAKARIGAIEEVRDIRVEIVWEPQWNPSMITPAGRQQLGLEV